MPGDSKGRYENDRDTQEYRNLINSIEKLTSRIDYLYESIKDNGITILEGKKEKIEQIAQKITDEEISSLRLIVVYKEKIIKILEGLLKTPLWVRFKMRMLAFLLLLAAPFIFVYTGIVKIKTGISNSLQERRERKKAKKLQKEQERQERALQKQRESEEKEREKQRQKEEKEALILQMEKEKEELALQKQREKEEKEREKQRQKEEKEALILQKQREKEEIAQQKEREKEDKELEKQREKEEREAQVQQEQKEKEEKALQEETQEKEQESQIPQESAPGIMPEESREEKEEEKEEEEKVPAFTGPSAAYYTPGKQTIPEQHIEQITPQQSAEEEDKEKTSYLKYIIPILLLLLLGILFFVIWKNYDSLSDMMKLAFKKDKTVENQAGKEVPFAKCLSDLQSSDDAIAKANEKLKDSFYCCFENRVTAIDPDIFDAWKQKNYEFIKCISENLSDDYMLVVIGHANKTGYEKDMKVYKTDTMLPQFIVGNYNYSTRRAKSFIEELNSSINQEIILYYGVGSSTPRTDEGLSPEDEQNRRITFKIMKKDESRNESLEWHNRLEEIDVVR